MKNSIHMKIGQMLAILEKEVQIYMQINFQSQDDFFAPLMFALFAKVEKKW